MGQNAINEDTGFFNEDTRSFWSTVNDGEEVSAGGAASLLIKNRKVFTYTDALNKPNDTFLHMSMRITVIK